MSPNQRQAAGAIAVRLARAAREVVRAVQAADEGSPEVLTFLLYAELNVDAVAHALAEVRRAEALETVTGGGALARSRQGQDAAGRFTKVQDLQPR